MDTEAKPKMIAFWMGRRVDEMTREELIDAVHVLGRLRERDAKEHLRIVNRTTDIFRAARPNGTR